MILLDTSIQCSILHNLVRGGHLNSTHGSYWGRKGNLTLWAGALVDPCTKVVSTPDVKEIRLH